MSTAEWQSFELRMRRRRAQRCLVRAEVAFEAGFIEDAREALDEARRLNAAPDEIARIEQLVAAGIPVVDPPVIEEPRPRRLSWKAIAAAAALVGAATALVSSPALRRMLEPAPVVQPRAAARPAEPRIEAPAVTVQNVLTTPAAVLSTAGADAPPAAEDRRPAPQTEVETAPGTPTRPSVARAEMLPANAAPVTTQPANAAPAAPLAANGAPAARPVTVSSIDAPPPAPARLMDVPIAAGPPPAPARLMDVPTAAAPPLVTTSLPPPAAAPPPAAGAGEETAAIAGDAAPVPAPTAMPVRDEAIDVRSILSRYENAYSELDPAQARAIWPGVNDKALTRAFSGLASQRVSLGRCDVTVNGARARAVCTGSATWTPKVGGGTRTEDRRWTFDLAKSGETWRIERARTAR